MSNEQWPMSNDQYLRSNVKSPMSNFQWRMFNVQSLRPFHSFQKTLKTLKQLQFVTYYFCKSIYFCQGLKQLYLNKTSMILVTSVLLYLTLLFLKRGGIYIYNRLYHFFKTFSDQAYFFAQHVYRWNRAPCKISGL